MGRRIHQCPPYVDNATLPDHVERLERGLPIPVQCCWNGMVVMDAKAFHKGLRFRYAEVTDAQQQYYLQHGKTTVPGERGEECSASECSLLCKDIWANHGERTRIVMDPSVKVAYQQDRRWFYEHRHEAWPRIDYGDRRIGLAAGLPFGDHPSPTQVECCPMKTRSGLVGDILYGKPGVCYNESTTRSDYREQSPLLFP